MQKENIQNTIHSLKEEIQSPVTRQCLLWRFLRWHIPLIINMYTVRTGSHSDEASCEFSPPATTVTHTRSLGYLNLCPSVTRLFTSWLDFFLYGEKCQAATQYVSCIILSHIMSLIYDSYNYFWPHASVHLLTLVSTWAIQGVRGLKKNEDGMIGKGMKGWVNSGSNKGKSHSRKTMAIS